MSPNIYVTALGIVSGLGIGTAETVQALRAVKSKVKQLKNLQTNHIDIPCAEVSLSDIDIQQILKIDADEVITRTSLLGILAAQEAFNMAGLTKEMPNQLRIGFLNGTTVGGMERSEQYYNDFIDPQSNNYTPYIAAHDCGACTEKIADYIGHFDYVSTTSTACSSAVNTLILACNMIEAGLLDVVLAGGTECLTKFHLNGFNSLMILDRKPCRSFDETRAGLNLGEGAAYLVIESEKAIKQRQINPIAQISGWGNACDAYHQTASSPDGKGAMLSMQQALDMSGLTPSDIDYINAHGTGTDNNDESEGMAVMNLFGAKIPPISSTKGYTGHTTSAAGSVEAVIALLAMQHRFLPPNLNFTQQMHQLSFSPVTELVENVEIKHILNNSFGFGGNNSSIIFSKLNSR